MKYATLQWVTCRGCGNIELVSSTDATIFAGSQSISVTNQTPGLMTGEPEQDYGPGCQPVWADTIHEPFTEKYSFAIFKPVVGDRILRRTWWPVCTLLITHTNTHRNCPALLFFALMTANDLTQIPIQMVQGAPLSVVEARSWSLYPSDVEINLCIWTSAIPHSSMKLFNYQLRQHYLYPVRPLASSFCTQSWTATHPVRLWYCYNNHLTALPLEPTTDKTHLQVIFGQSNLTFRCYTTWRNFDTCHVFMTLHAAPTTAPQLFAS